MCFYDNFNIIFEWFSILILLFVFLYLIDKKYASTLSKQLGLRGKARGKLGDDLDADTIQLLKDDQIVQLYELMLATKNLQDKDVAPK